jgi:hypothetical protein
MTREGSGVLPLRTPIAARLRLRAAGGPPLRVTPAPSPLSRHGQSGGVLSFTYPAEGWREGEASAARTEGSTVEVRSDRTPTRRTGLGA